jgi:branched-subunit amino acid ABC-type transport system permease component
MLGAYFTYTVYSIVTSHTEGFLSALLVVPIVMILIGAVIDLFLLRRVVTWEAHYIFILTFALTMIITDSVKFFWGRGYRTVPRPSLLEGSVQILDRPFPSYYLMLIGLGLLFAVSIGVLMNRTRFGKVIRGAVSDREMVSALGHNVPLLNTLVFALGSGLSGLGGVLAAPVGSIALGMDNSILIEAFACVIIGTPGNVYGALLAALLISVIHSFGILVAPRLAIAFIFMVLCTVLVFMPQGLMGKRR